MTRPDPGRALARTVLASFAMTPVAALILWAVYR